MFVVSIIEGYSVFSIMAHIQRAINHFQGTPHFHGRRIIDMFVRHATNDLQHLFVGATPAEVQAMYLAFHVEYFAPHPVQWTRTDFIHQYDAVVAQARQRVQMGPPVHRVVPPAPRIVRVRST